MGNSKSKAKKADTQQKSTEQKPEEKKEEKKEENKEEKKDGFIQTGGHVGAFKKLDGGKIMKRVGKNEFQFYSETLGKYPNVNSFLPKFHGTQNIEDSNYIIIEDLTHYYKTPCILDIKIGVTSVGEDASPEKKDAMGKKDKETTTWKLGLRITAMKIWQADKKEYISFGKDWGKKVTEDTFLESLLNYFRNGKETRTDIVAPYLEFLRKLLQFFEEQCDLRYYSSSLLFLYDADQTNKDATPQIRMIDFAHVHEIKDGGKDEGYITGLKNLIGFFEKIK
jgi:hypothetical protein